MLDELLYVFLRALEFDGDDPLPLITEWNYAIAHVQKVFDRMTDKDAKLVEVVRCRDCKHYNAGFECLIEGYGIERPSDYFCADGERK